MIMHELRVLYIEDDQVNREELKDALSGEAINDCVITLDCEESFEDATKRVQVHNYHLVILDLMKGDKDMGSEIYNQIRSVFFTPIIFYAAKTAEVESLKSQVVGVASKIDGIEALKAEIDRLTKHGLPLLKEWVHHFIEQEFKSYFWDTIQDQNNIFKAGEEDFSLGYLLLRKFADSLSKDNIKEILHDEFISTDKVHPMEFYIYPVNCSHPFESGEIIRDKAAGDIYIILTPSCDFIERFDKKGVSQGANAKRVVLAHAKLLTNTQEYQAFSKNQNNDNRERLKGLIEARRGDRYFFLPQTPFIDNFVLDFQDTKTIDIDDLAEFDRIAKLDAPFAQALVSSYIRYYDRIGFPDIDADYIIKLLGF